MSNHNKIRPVDKKNLNGKYKILFSTPQTKNSNIPMEFRGLQIYNSKFLAEEALRKRKKLTKNGAGMVEIRCKIDSNLLRFSPVTCLQVAWYVCVFAVSPARHGGGF